MKPINIILASAAILLFVSCTKEGKFKPEQRLVRVYSESVKETFEFYSGEHSLRKEVVIPKYKYQQFVWDEKKLNEILTYDTVGNVISHITLSYNLFKRVSKCEQDGNYYAEYKYMWGKLNKYTLVVGGKSAMEFEVEHEDGKIVSLTAEINTDNFDTNDIPFLRTALSLVFPKCVSDMMISMPPSRTKAPLVMTFHYSADNLVKIDLGSDFSVEFEYDTRPNPIQGCYAYFGPTAISANNIVKVNGYPYTYTYNAFGHPETVAYMVEFNPPGNYRYETTTTETYEYVAAENFTPAE